MSNEVLTALEIDAVGEVLNISLGSSATAISNLLDKRVDITTPNVNVVSYDKFEFTYLEPATGVEITYTEGLEGNNIMVFKRRDIKAIVEMLMSCEIPDEEFELNEMNISAICEVMNQMMGASSTALSEFLGEAVNISTPVAFQINDSQEFKDKYFTSADSMVTVRFHLKIESVLESEFLCLLPITLAKRILKSFSLEDAYTEEPSVAPEAVPSAAPQPQPAEPVAVQPAASPPQSAAPEATQLTAPPPQPAPPPSPQPAAPVYQAPAEPQIINVQQQNFVGPGNVDLGKIAEEHANNLDLIMSVPLQISVEIGRTRRPLKEILEFLQGTLVMLDKLAGDHVDLYVNGQCVAKGDVVVVDDSFGLRITQIIKPVEINK